MAQNVQQIVASARPYNNPSRLPIRPNGLGKGNSSQPNSMTVEINWADYGISLARSSASITIDLNSGLNGSFPLDQIRSIVIDNTFSLVPVYVYFPDTRLTYFAPANSTATLQVSTGQLAFIIFVEGVPANFVPRTVIELTNVILAPLVIYNPNNVPVLGGFYQGQSRVAAGTNSQTFVFANVPNAAITGRIIVASIGVARAGTQILTPFEVTINSAPMFEATSNNSFNLPLNLAWAFAINYLPLDGTSNVTIVVNPNTPCDLWMCSLYTIYRTISVTPSLIYARTANTTPIQLTTFTNDPVTYGSASILASGPVNNVAPALPTVLGATRDYSTNLAYPAGPAYSAMSSLSKFSDAGGESVIQIADASAVAGANWR